MPVTRHRRSVPGSQLSQAEYGALAEFRFRLACFLRRRQLAARAVGLEPQQYELLLGIAGLPQKKQPTIKELASQLLLEHHSVVELADRLEQKGLLARTSLGTDKRVALLVVTPAGQRALRRVAGYSLTQVRTEAPALLRSLRRTLRRRS
jgi:DNA-binding MarR family transcriptional regulator